MSGRDTLYQQVREHLHTLGLHAAADRLAPALEQADRDRPGYTEFLHEMLTASLRCATSARILPPERSTSSSTFSANTVSIAGRLRSTTGVPPASSRCRTQYATVL